MDEESSFEMESTDDMGQHQRNKRGGENVSGDWKWNKKEGNGGVEQNLRR